MNLDQLGPLLRAAGRRIQIAGLTRAGCLALAAVILALLLVIGFDAALGLPGWVLVAMDVILIAVAGAAAIYLLVVGYRLRFDPRRIARQLEQVAGINDSRLINAYDLAVASPEQISADLRDYAVQQGEQAAVHISPARAVNHDPVVRGVGLLGLIGLSGLLAYLLVPGAFHAVMPRLLWPYADHPPYTMLEFDVSFDPQRIMYGKPASIQVAITGPRKPEQATVVFIDQAGRRQPLPMMSLASSTEASGDGAARFVAHLDRAEQSRTFHIATPYGRSRRYVMQVLPVPLFEHVQLTYHYPEYTGWESDTSRLSSRGIAALSGTTVELSVTSNVALGGGQLTISQVPDSEPAAPTGTRPPDKTVTLSPDPSDPSRVRGSFVLDQPGRFELSLIGADGTPGDRTLAGRLEPMPDKHPRIHIEQPLQRVVVPEDWQVDVVIRASDDIGVERIELFRGINGWGPWPVGLALDPPHGRRTEAQAVFDLAPLGAKAGDVINYFAEAKDGHPSAAQAATTDVHVIEVITWEEYLEYARTRRGLEEIITELNVFEDRLADLAEQRVELLKQMQPLQFKLESGQPLSDAERESLERLGQRLSAYQQQAAELAEEMRQWADQPQLYDFEPALRDMAGQIAQDLGRQQAVAGSVERSIGSQIANRSPSSAEASQMAQAMQRFAEQTDPFAQQQVAQRQDTRRDLERAHLANQMIAQAQRIRQVIQGQGELADRMARFRNSEQLSPSEQIAAARMAREQENLRKELADATTRLEQLSRQAGQLLPLMCGSADRLTGRIRQLEVENDQSDARRLAAAGEGRYASIAARTAARKLDSLLSDCDQAAGLVSEDLDGCLNLPRDGWSNAIRQLAAGRAIGMGKAGGDGSGYSGSMASMAVMGPMNLSQGESDARSRLGSGRGDGRGGRTSAADAPVDPAERLDPGRTTRQAGSAAPMPGVPARYRQAAEAYFRRLADESR
jgi:hypothetical protein